MSELNHKPLFHHFFVIKNFLKSKIYPYFALKSKILCPQRKNIEK